MGTFEASIKSLVAAIELYQSRLDFIIDDLIEFYDSEMVIIDQLGLEAMQNANSQQTYGRGK